MDKLICYIVSGLLQWFFHFGEQIVIAGLISGEMFQNLPLPAVQKVRDTSDVTTCIVMKNDEVLYHQVSSFSPDYDVFAKVKEPL